MAHMPPTYAACLYVQPKSFADKLASFRTQTGSNQQQSTPEQIRSVCGAVRFDGGKIRDIWFVGVPKQQQTQRLSRSAAALGTSDTFLYLATLLNPDRLGGLNQPGADRWHCCLVAKGFQRRRERRPDRRRLENGI